MESTTFERDLRVWKRAWTSEIRCGVQSHAVLSKCACIISVYVFHLVAFLLSSCFPLHHNSSAPCSCLSSPHRGLGFTPSFILILFFILLSIESRSCGPTLFIHPFLHIFSAIAIYQDVVAIFSGGLSFDTPTTETSYKSCRIFSSSSHTFESSISHWSSLFSHTLSAVVSSSSSVYSPSLFWSFFLVVSGSPHHHQLPRFICLWVLLFFPFLPLILDLLLL